MGEAAPAEEAAPLPQRQGSLVLYPRAQSSHNPFRGITMNGCFPARGAGFPGEIAAHDRARDGGDRHESALARRATSTSSSKSVLPGNGQGDDRGVDNRHHEEAYAAKTHDPAQCLGAMPTRGAPGNVLGDARLILIRTRGRVGFDSRCSKKSRISSIPRLMHPASQARDVGTRFGCPYHQRLERKDNWGAGGNARASAA